MSRGTGSRVAAVTFRVLELVFATIVVAILGRFLYFINQANADANSRLVYAEVLAALSMAFSIVLMPPFAYQFWAFPLDFAMFVMWIVAFGLLDNLTGRHTCSSAWYYNYWGYYWGRFYLPGTVRVIGTPGCGQFRTALAFSFMSGICWLVSVFVGTYWVFKYGTGGAQADGLQSTNGTNEKNWFGKKKKSSANRESQNVLSSAPA